MNQKRDFYDDLAFGQKGEVLMTNFFIIKLNEKTQTHKWSIIETGTGKSWDVKAQAYKKIEDKVSIFPDSSIQPIHIEIKTDVYHTRTGNMFIELKSRGKKSGLDATKSDFFVYFFMRTDLYPQDNVWMISTKALKQLSHKWRNDPRYERRGGDNNSSEALVIPLEELKQYFKVLTYTDYEMVYSQQLGVETKIVTKKKIGFEF